MRLGGEHLASFAGFDYLLGVLYRRQLVKANPKSFGRDCSTACVVSTDTFVYVLEDNLPLFWCDASLENTQDAPLV
jgi:hypothetical protein